LLGLGLDSDDDAKPDASGPGGLARVGRYRILDRIGAGGMGRVYRARDTALDRDVAIKVLPDEFAEDHERLARFRREARLLASLNHPHIAAIYGLEEADDVLFLVLELVEGETLASRIDRGPLPMETALEMALQMSEALEAAHEKGIVHRDLKPSNAMITSMEQIKLLDFGIAKATPARDPSEDTTRLTATGTVVGTTAYMSPEQVRGAAVDERSDIWSLGCVLFEALAGRPAFERVTPADTLSAILQGEPDFAALPVSTPAAVRDLLRQALKKDPDERLATIEAVQASIQRALTEARAGEREDVSWLARRLGTSLAIGSIVLTTAALFVSITGRSLGGTIPTAVLSDGGSVALILIVVTSAILGLWTLARRTGRLIRRASRRTRTVLLGVGVFVSVVVALVFAAHTLRGWRDDPSDSRQDDRLDVYVVLPFEKLNDERQEELLDVTEHYRSTLESIFADLESVRVMPEVYEVESMRALPPQCSYGRAADWLAESELTADVVLCSTVDLFDDRAEHSGVTLVSRISRVQDERLEPMTRLIRQAGSYSEIAWLALRTSHRIVRLLEEDPGLGLSERDRERVRKRVLERFQVFLGFMAPSGDVAARVEQALARSRVSDAEIDEILSAYVSTVDLEGYASRNDAARSAFTSRMSGGSP
jgi:hypothetical protein